MDTVNVDCRFIKELFYCKEDQLYTTAALTNGKVNFFKINLMLKFMMAYDFMFDDCMMNCVCIIAIWHNWDHH